MEEPTVNSYETFIDVEARDEIGAVNFKEKGTTIAFQLVYWSARNVSSGEKTNHYTPIPPHYGHVGAFSNINGEYTELELVDCRLVLTETEFSNSALFFQDSVSDGSVYCVDPNNA